MKCLISTNQSEPDRAIDMIKDDFLASFKNIVLEYRQWQKNKMVGDLCLCLNWGSGGNLDAISHVEVSATYLFIYSTL